MPIPRRVAFVRAIMIGREGLHREVVLDLFRDAGAIEPRNHLATGNVSFGARSADVAPIVAHVEQGIAAIVGRHKPIFVRTLDHLARLVHGSPPAPLPFGDVRGLELVFLPHGATVPDLPLVSRSGGTTVFASTGSELWSISLPGDAPGGFVERLLGVPVTVRACSTIEKIVAAHR